MKRRIVGVLVLVAFVEAAVALALPWRAAIAVALSVGAFVAALAGMLLARSLRGEMLALAEATNRLRDGESPVPALRSSEAAALSRAVVELAESLAARAEGARRDAALRETVLSSMTEGVLLSEPAGAVVYANDVANALLGEPRTLPSSVAEEGAHELTVYHPERREVRAVTTRIGGGRTLVVLQDVTEAKRVEAIRRDFVADASHEMKTPVAAVLATAETLEQAVDDDPETARRFASRLVAESRRLSELVKDLLDLSRIEQGAADGERVSLSSLVEGELDRIREDAEAKGLKLHAEIVPDLRVEGRAEDLSLAVRNLLENAVRYTEEGDVRVALAAADGDAVLTVADTGSGIPQKDLPRIFERFYRVDKARSRDTGGTGLGLSIVRHVVETHGGTVRAESELGRGSVFTLTLRLA